MPNTAETLTDQERLALEAGLARWHRGRLIPIMRGAETEDGAAEGAGGDGSGGAAAGEWTGEPQGGREFTPITSQEKFDRIIAERLAKERAKFVDPSRFNITKDQFEDLKAKAQRLSEIEEANKSELEKERDRAAKAEERANKIEAEAKEIRLSSALLAEAARPGRMIVDAEAAISLLDRSSLKLDANGNPTNVAEAMDSLLKAKPYLVATNGGTRGNADQGARGGSERQLTREQLKKMSPAEIVKAQNDGLLDHLLSGGNT